MRLLLEAVGLLLAAATHVFVFLVYFLGASLGPFVNHQAAYWFLIAAGYLGIALVMITAKTALGAEVTPRRLLDVCLLTYFGALLAATVCVRLNWPISLRGWDAHGMGAQGGEGNMMLLPWLHLACILSAGRAMLRARWRGRQAIPS